MCEPMEKFQQKDKNEIGSLDIIVEQLISELKKNYQVGGLLPYNLQN